jgi:hypothetical protein
MNRPYSSLELRDLERNLYAKHRLSDNIAQHTPCNHTYRVKKGGRKEQYLRENGSILDDQTCSVCFKIRTVGDAPYLLTNENQPLSRALLHDVDSFYKWLYRHDYS